MKKRVLITGATGYVGQHLVPLLSSSSYEIMTLNRSVSKANMLFKQSNISHVAIEAMSKEVVRFNPHIVIHLATLSTSSSAKDMIEPLLESNLHFGIQLLDILQACDAFKFFVNLGSFAEYRLNNRELKDAYLYTATKSAFRHFVDFYCEKNSWKYCTVVPYSIYGGQDTSKKIMDFIIESIDAKEPVGMTLGEQSLDFIHVNDVVCFFEKLVRDETLWIQLPQGISLPLGSGTSHTIRQVADIVEKITKKTCQINWGARPYRPLDVMKAKADLSIIQAYMDWKPMVSLTQGLEERIKLFID